MELLQAVPKFDLSFLPDKEKKETSYLVLRINIKLFLHGQTRNLIWEEFELVDTEFLGNNLNVWVISHGLKVMGFNRVPKIHIKLLPHTY